MGVSSKHRVAWHDSSEASTYMQCMPQVGVGHQLDTDIIPYVLVSSI